MTPKKDMLYLDNVVIEQKKLFLLINRKRSLMILSRMDSPANLNICC